MSSKSSIHLMIFYMQSKEMFKLTPQLCRIAKKEFEDTKAELPEDVRDDLSFNKVLELIELVENSKFAKANELLGDAYKEHEEMMSYFTPKKRVSRNESPPSIFEERWEPPVRQDIVPTPTQAVVNQTLNEDDSRNWNDRSPVHRSRSRIHRSKSPVHRSKSPVHRSKSPVHRSKSPVHRSKSPVHRSKSPVHRSKSPVHRSKSPVHGSKSPVHRSKSPVHRSKSPLYRSKSPVHSKREDKKIMNGSGTGDEENNIHRLTYMTTLRPKDSKSNYETVYVSHSPAVLAENFTKLYKTDWRAAHDELGDTLGEKQTVRHMLWIIAKASIICASLATQQLADLENSVVGIMVSRDPLNKMCLTDESLAKKNEKTVTKGRNMLVDYRRELAILSVPMLQKEIKRAIASELGTSLPRRFTGIGNHFITYAEKVIELIWLMYVHDPPMHLEWLTKEQEGTKFNADLYSLYTGTGTLYDYCVWPLVRLYKNGPVLCKGIAQGR